MGANEALVLPRHPSLNPLILAGGGGGMGCTRKVPRCCICDAKRGEPPVLLFLPLLAGRRAGAML